MACYRPLKAFRTPTGVVFSELRRDDILGPIDLACGQCIGCRMRRASDWELRVMHEASLWTENSFVTLTYARDCLPADGSLEYRDYQLFMKRLRKHAKRPVRFYMCGEYGDLNKRPHFHACLFNVDFREDRVLAGKSGSGALFYDSATLSKLWGHGRVSVQDLTKETASYCARYIMKKVLGPDAERSYEDIDGDGVVHRRRPEFAVMSLKPGIGAAWLDRFSSDCVRHDFVIKDGIKRPLPKYYLRRFARGARFLVGDEVLERDVSRETVLDKVEVMRAKRVLERAGDTTADRLRVRELVHAARVSKLVRSFES